MNLNKIEQLNSIRRAMNFVLRLIDAVCSILTSGTRIHRNIRITARGSYLAKGDEVSIYCSYETPPKIRIESKCFITIVTNA